MRVYLASAENIIRNMIKANLKKRMFYNINEWLNKITLVPNEGIRKNLYNIEQYRADSIPVVEVKGKSYGNGGL
jgi:hypothetical protein